MFGTKVMAPNNILPSKSENAGVSHWRLL